MTMTRSPAQVLRQYLVDLQAVVGTTPSVPTDWASVVDEMPADVGGPDNYVAIADTGDLPGAREANTGERTVYPSVQILVRSLDYPTGYQKIKEIEGILDKLGIPSTNGGAANVPVVVDGDNYVISTVTVTTPSRKIGRDEQGDRVLFSLNARLNVFQSTPDTYQRFFPNATPTVDDYLVGLHNGWLSRFLMSDVLNLGGGGGGGGGFSNQPPHYVFVGPVSGANAQPGFRLLTLDDVPDRYDHS